LKQIRSDEKLVGIYFDREVFLIRMSPNYIPGLVEAIRVINLTNGNQGKA